MDATSFLHELRRAFPAITFEAGDEFRWSPQIRTIFLGPFDSERDYVTLVHEVGHAVAGHEGYERDIDLIKLEREAWIIAQRDIAPQFNIEIADEIIEEALDSYRDWLHARSLCPECHQNGVQRTIATYACLLCHTEWRVNDARRCGLKRYRLHPKTPT